MLVSFRGGMRFLKADLSPSTRGHHPVLRRPWTRDDLLGRYDRFAERYGHWGRGSESRSQAFAGLLAGRAVVSGPGSDPLLCVGSVQPVHVPVISFVLDVVAFRCPARFSQNEPVFLMVIGCHPIQVDDPMGPWSSLTWIYSQLRWPSLAESPPCRNARLIRTISFRVRRPTLQGSRRIHH
jgi:hypothetical protein